MPFANVYSLVQQNRLTSDVNYAGNSRIVSQPTAFLVVTASELAANYNALINTPWSTVQPQTWGAISGNYWGSPLEPFLIQLFRDVTVNDPAGAIDSTSFSVSKVLTDSAGAIDLTAFIVAKQFDDPAGATDSSPLSKTLGINEVAGAVDLVAFLVGKVFTDDPGATDPSVVVGPSAGLTLSLSFSEDTGAFDQPLPVKTMPIIVDEVAGAFDQVPLNKTLGINEDAGATDSQVYSKSLVFTDDPGSIDTSSVLHSILITVTEIAGAVDVIFTSGSRSLTFNENAGAVDRTNNIGAVRVRAGWQAVMYELIAAGYLTGTIADREQARLVYEAGGNPLKDTLYDLYEANNERPRLI